MPVRWYTVGMPKNDPREKLVAAIRNSKTVERNGDTYVFTIGRSPKHFTQEQVEQYDPRLPKLIETVNYYNRYVSGQLMRKTLMHWYHPATKLDDASENLYMSRPTAIEYEPKKACFTIKGTRYKTILTTDDTPLEVVVNIGKKVFADVTDAWLDTHYPGMRIQVELLMALGVDPKRIAKQVLAELPPLAEVPDMDGITFD